MTIRITALVNGNYSDQDVLNSLRNDLSTVGTVTDIRLIQGKSQSPANNNSDNASNPKGDKDISDYLRDLGAKLGFSPTSALIGGVAVAAIVAIVVLKKD
jgi:hypothetical protein